MLYKIAAGTQQRHYIDYAKGKLKEKKKGAGKIIH